MAENTTTRSWTEHGFSGIVDRNLAEPTTATLRSANAEPQHDSSSTSELANNTNNMLVEDVFHSIVEERGVTSQVNKLSMEQSDAEQTATGPNQETAEQERLDHEYALSLQNQSPNQGQSCTDERDDGETEGRKLTAAELLDQEFAMALQAAEDFDKFWIVRGQVADQAAHGDLDHFAYLLHRDQDSPPETEECVCGEAYPTHALPAHVYWLDCGHVRCAPCLTENIRVGLESRKNFPPKCCGPIRMSKIIGVLDDDNLKRWNEIRAEYEDVSPVHCAVNDCSLYLGKEWLVEEGRWALCNVCSVRTCTGCLCLESAHEEADKCPERIDKLDMGLMQREGWRPCPQCKAMIEKEDGCDHMQCECDHEFCYICGQSYTGGMPCNCNGQREWVEEDPEEHDPQVQRDLFNHITNPFGDWEIHDGRQVGGW